MRHLNFFAVIAGLYVVLSVLTYNPNWFSGGDNAKYIALAESITHGDYRSEWLLDRPVHSQYPPGLPLLLAPFVALFGFNALALKAVIILCGLAILWFLWQYMGEYRSLEVRKCMMLIVGTLPVLYYYNHFVLSEIPSMMVVFASLYCFGRGKLTPGVILAVASCMIRTANIAFVIAVFAYLTYNKQWRHVAMAGIVGGVVIGGWHLWGVLHPEPITYFNTIWRVNPYQWSQGMLTFGQFLDRIAYNLVAYIHNIIPSMIIPTGNNLLTYITGLVVVMLLVDQFRYSWAWAKIVNLYVLAAFVVALIWPEIWSGDRFMLPILPLIITLLLHWFWYRLHLRLMKIITAILVGINLCAIIRQAPKWQTPPPEVTQQFLRDCNAVPLTTVIKSRKPELVYLYTGRRSIQDTGGQCE